VIKLQKIKVLKYTSSLLVRTGLEALKIES